MSKTASTSDPDSAQRPSKFDSLPESSRISRGLHPRRNPHSWFAFRFALGVFGAALVLLPLALPQSWIASIFGLVFFLTAILLPASLRSHPQAEKIPAHPSTLVFNGAEFCPEFAPPVPVQLFIGEDQILAMKSNLHPAAVISTTELSSVLLQRAGNSWLLLLLSAGKETAFSFRGFFAERRARKAEAAIRNVLRVAPPEKPKARAARA